MLVVATPARARSDAGRDRAPLPPVARSAWRVRRSVPGPWPSCAPRVVRGRPGRNRPCRDRAAGPGSWRSAASRAPAVARLWTTDPTGVVSFEAGATLGDLFTVWGRRARPCPACRLPRRCACLRERRAPEDRSASPSPARRGGARPRARPDHPCRTARIGSRPLSASCRPRCRLEQKHDHDDGRTPAPRAATATRSLSHVVFTRPNALRASRARRPRRRARAHRAPRRRAPASTSRRRRRATSALR